MFLTSHDIFSCVLKLFPHLNATEVPSVRCMQRPQFSLLHSETLWLSFIYEPAQVMTKPTKWHVHPGKTLISLGICPVWSESSLCTQWVAKELSFLHADREDWLDWVDTQADLSLCWVHMPFCRFCHVLAQITVSHDSVDRHLGLVVQSILSVTSSLVVKKVNCSSKYNTKVTGISSKYNTKVTGIFAEKMWLAFANAKATQQMQKLLTFFQQKYWHICHI